MLRLPFEAFLALRYFRPRGTFVSIITIISIIGVMLGVGVMIVVISVMAGFDKEWRDRILGFNAHLKIYQVGQPMDHVADVLSQVRKDRSIQGAAPFIRDQVVMQVQGEDDTPKAFSPAALLGVDPENVGAVSVLPKSIKSGQFNLDGSGLVIGYELADHMGLAVGDRVNIYSRSSLERMARHRGKENQEATLPVEFTIRGIFDVGYSEFNSGVAVVSLESAQQLAELPEDTVHGLQIMLADPFQADRVRAELVPLLGPDYHILTWREETPKIFNALVVEKNMMFFLLFFIMIVAGFGIVNCQLTFVVQKTREIGILKALGARNGKVLLVFLSQSVVVGFFGVLLGYGMAMLSLAYRNEFLGLMNRLTGFELLPADIYQINQLPVSIQAGDIIVICGTAFVTCVLAGVFPAWKASRLQPVEALRHE